MSRSIKCPKCQLWFSAEKYTTCPHCIEIAEEQALKKSKEQMITNAVVAYLRSEEAAKKDAEFRNMARMDAKKENGKDNNRQEESDRQAETNSGGETDSIGETKREEKHEETIISAGAVGEHTENVHDENKNGNKKRKSFLRTDMPEFLKPNRTSVTEMKAETDNEEAPRTMGWLLCVRGPKYGESIPVRSDRMLLPEKHPCAVFVSDHDSGKVFLYPGVAGSMCSRNEEKVNDAMLLEGFDRITLGSDPEQLYLFIPLCGENFHWKEWPKMK